MSHASYDIDVEDDPTPLVRVVARVIRQALPHVDSTSLRDAGRAEATVTVSSRDDRQALTCTFTATGIFIRHGAAAGEDAALVVDVQDDLALDAEASSGDAALLDLAGALLRPPVPGWRDAVQEFWRLTSVGRGMPQQLVVDCTDEGERLVLGAGVPTYTLSASGTELARVFSGSTPLLNSVFTGAVAVRGTLPQLSVMAGASNKVRFNV